MPSILHDVRWHSVLLWNWNLQKIQTVSISEPDMRALDWIRTNTEQKSIFAQDWQPFYLRGGLDAWIPIFTGRAVLASGRGTCLTDTAKEQNRLLFESDDGDSAYEICESAQIDFIYNSRIQSPKSYKRMEEVLSQASEKFKRVFSAEGVSVWRVKE